MSVDTLSPARPAGAPGRGRNAKARRNEAMRLQLALNVRNLDEAVDFYTKLFDTPPHKRKPGYANFAIERPPLKLVVFEDADVHSATDRLKAAGMEHLVEDESTCCYAKQNKVWAREPEGLRWEWYRVTRDAESFAK